MADIDAYKDKFSDSGRRVLETALDESRRRDQNYVSIEHVLHAVAREEDDLFTSTMRDLAVDPRSVRLLIEKRLDSGRQHTGKGFRIAPETTELFKRAMDRARSQGRRVIDGSDMIFLPVRNGWLRPMYDEVIVDEAQDMTTAQLEIALGVMKPTGRMAVVGDNRQAIFGFRGADSNSLDRLKQELNADELGLTRTYRCGKVIVERAQGFVPDLEADENNPDGEIVEVNTSKIVDMAGPGDFILSRINAPIVSIAMQLLRRGKRTRILGRDIGKGLVALVRKLRANSVPDFHRKVEAWAKKEHERLEAQIEEAKPGRKATIQSKMEGITDQADMLISLAEDATGMDQIISRIEDLFSKDETGVDGLVTCSSVHKAKGLEANRVFVLQDTMRSWNIEEQNIEYVAITRAKQTLVIASQNFEVK